MISLDEWAEQSANMALRGRRLINAGEHHGQWLPDIDGWYDLLGPHRIPTGIRGRISHELYRQVVKAKKLEAYHHFGQTRVFMPDDPLNPMPGTTYTHALTTR